MHFSKDKKKKEREEKKKVKAKKKKNGRRWLFRFELDVIMIGFRSESYLFQSRLVIDCEMKMRWFFLSMESGEAGT